MAQYYTKHETPYVQEDDDITSIDCIKYAWTEAKNVYGDIGDDDPKDVSRSSRISNIISNVWRYLDGNICYMFENVFNLDDNTLNMNFYSYDSQYNVKKLLKNVETDKKTLLMEFLGTKEFYTNMLSGKIIKFISTIPQLKHGRTDYKLKWIPSNNNLTIITRDGKFETFSYIELRNELEKITDLAGQIVSLIWNFRNLFKLKDMLRAHPFYRKNVEKTTQIILPDFDLLDNTKYYLPCAYVNDDDIIVFVYAEIQINLGITDNKITFELEVKDLICGVKSGVERSVVILNKLIPNPIMIEYENKNQWDPTIYFYKNTLLRRGTKFVIDDHMLFRELELDIDIIPYITDNINSWIRNIKYLQKLESI